MNLVKQLLVKEIQVNVFLYKCSIITGILFIVFSGSPVVRTIQTSFKSSRFEIIGVVSWSKGIVHNYFI